MTAQPEFQQQQFQKKLHDPRIFVVCVLAVIGGALFACSLSVTPVSPGPTQTAPSIVPTVLSGQGQTPGLSVTIQTVTIETGIDLSQPSQSPRFWLETGQGHYLLYVVETQKLIYDGSLVYSGALKADLGEPIALSHNGLHYAYIASSVDKPDFNDLYVDGVKVATAKYLSLPAVTDDGQHYFYTACNNENGITGTCLFKDGKDVFLHSDGILGIWISGDGSTYFASLRNLDSNGNFKESLVRNGEEIYKGNELADKSFSNNGQHYAYVTVDFNTKVQNLVVDGNPARRSTALILRQVTDLGSYCAWDSAQKKVYVNEREFPVGQESGVMCYINDDGSHVLLYDGGWLLDGQSIQLPNIQDAEFVAETLYVYSFVH